MEFRKATKIVILAIVISAIIGIAAVEAYDVKDCPKCPDSGLKFWNGLDYIPNYLGCSYFTSIDPFISGNEGHIGITEHYSKEEAVNDFEKIRKCGKTNVHNSGEILKDNQIEFVYMTKGFVNFEIHGYFLHIDKKIITHVVIKRRGISYGDREKAKTMFQEFAKCAHSITGWKGTEDKEEYTLTLKHYEPYYKPGENDPRRPGDLVATLTDKNGKGVSSKQIFFYLEDNTRLNEVLVPRATNDRRNYADISERNCADIFNRFIYPTTGGSYIGYDLTTGKYGEANSEYFSYLRRGILSKIIRDTHKSVKGEITVVVFNPETNKIGQKASVNIELSSVAKITNISVHGEKREILDREGEIILKRVVNEQNEQIMIVQERDCRYKGYDLLCGDVISLDKDDCIELLWLDGMKIKVITKPHVLKEDMVDITIGKRELAHQLSRDMYDFRQHDLFSTITLGGAGAILGFCALPIIVPTIGIPVTTVGAIGYPALALGLASIGIAFEGIYYGETPFVISRMKSKILVDPTNSGINFYTVEGSNELTTPKGSKREIITGHKISLLPDGTFSQISEFDRSELSEELSYLLESIEKDESGITSAPALTPEKSELEISKLYVGKPAYPIGTEVDVYFDVKNIGTVDVDEFYVECRINDLKGNEMYKFVGSTLSIASGKRQKFVAAENWKIPSDAKIGPYIINCTLIWDSKRDTAGREFFVTHPANREDRTAELEISNLYTGKSEYLKGAGEIVDVCYYVKNTGTVDISEYHVIYQIFDSEGKRYCWFISDMFGSIVAGKEDKWQSGVWKVPSDAKVGRYTVEAMVIWGLDRFSRETVYFFVK